MLQHWFCVKVIASGWRSCRVCRRGWRGGAWMVLLAADGMPNAQIVRIAGVSRPTVIGRPPSGQCRRQCLLQTGSADRLDQQRRACLRHHRMTIGAHSSPRPAALVICWNSRLMFCWSNIVPIVVVKTRPLSCHSSPFQMIGRLDGVTLAKCRHGDLPELQRLPRSRRHGVSPARSDR